MRKPYQNDRVFLCRFFSKHIKIAHNQQHTYFLNYWNSFWHSRENH